MTSRFFPLLCAVAVMTTVLTSNGAVAVTTESSLAETNCLSQVQRRGGGSGLRAYTHSTSSEGLVTISIKGVGNSNWTCIAHVDGSVNFVSKDRSSNR